MENSKPNQSRFLTAVVLSFAVLFAWSYFFAPKPPPPDANANVAATNTQPTEQTPASSTPQATPAPTVAPVTADSVPNRVITVKSSLYEVKIDSKGAVASSWILIKDASPNHVKDIWADGSNDGDKKPLQLISDEARKRGVLPFRISTEDETLNSVVNGRNYQVNADGDSINVNDGEEKSLTFSLNDNGVEVTKTFVFRGDSYVSDLAVKMSRDGQPVTGTKLVIGASIGDHAINHHNFYHIESETVASIEGNINRHQGYYSFTYEKDASDSKLADTGTFDWAGLADAYFAMIAVPAEPG
ncbi:MAG TPA: membrane protein insertase YidC, partial [Pyrinomonadaceae bacterium]|nr:membrane protein insertase YidC [Pyrinomonadaceae bacterium]